MEQYSSSQNKSGLAGNSDTLWRLCAKHLETILIVAYK